MADLLYIKIDMDGEVIGFRMCDVHFAERNLPKCEFITSLFVGTILVCRAPLFLPGNDIWLYSS
jgi:hypothetical protein